MSLHKLLQKQIKKYLGDMPVDAGLEKFIAAVSDSYNSFDRDRELSSHAFSMSEKEYQEVNARLSNEFALKKISLDKLKEAIKEIDENNELHFSSESDDLPEIISYLRKQLLQKKESQEELQRLSLVASANTNGVLLTDVEGHIFWSNEAYYRLTGYAMAELAGHVPIEVAAGPLSDTVKIQYMVESYLQRKSFSIEVAYYRKDGSWFWARVKGQPILTADGQLLHYFSIIEDISQEKKQEEQIQRLSLVASANSKGVFILNEDKTYAWINPAFETITGYCMNDLEGKTPEWTIFEIQQDPFVADRIKFLGDSNEDFTEDFLHRKKDNSTFWARLNMQFVKNDNNEVVQLFGVLEDISREKDAEHAAFVQEEKYRSIIANMNLGLLEVDNEDRIQYANHSFMEMSGYDIDELIGRHAAEIFIIGENVQVVKDKNRLRKEGMSDAYELPVKNKRGELKYWLISGAPRYNDHGEVIGSIGIHLDITRQKIQEMELVEARKKAEESSEAKEAFLSNMSHEIRTPLNAIIGMLRELGKLPTSPKQRACLGSADTASRHLLSIINNILDMSKIEAGEFQLETRHFSLESVINESVSITSSNAAEKLIPVKVNIDKALQPAFVGDPARIRQILINILGNAIKFTDKGSITIDCHVIKDAQHSQKVSLAIIDTGIGMDKAYQKNLFNKFSQEDKSTARKYGGTGLGMAITYELIQLMGGEIIVESEKGKGTKVELQLPFETGNFNEIKNLTAEEDYNALKGVKVLLTEDNEMNRMVAINTLAHFGMEIAEAENGKIAIDMLQEEPYDVVLMDLHMPEMDGLEATRYIRQELKNNIPIIALTANAFKKEIDACIDAGMNDYVTKPFEESVLLQAILKYSGRQGKVKPKTGETPQNVQMEASEKLYDLTRLKDISHGDDEFLQKMISLFIDQASLSAEQMQGALDAGDHKTISETAHRLKASAGNMGMVQLRQNLADLENISRDEPGNAGIPALLSATVSLIKNVNQQLASELK